MARSDPRLDRPRDQRTICTDEAEAASPAALRSGARVSDTIAAIDMSGGRAVTAVETRAAETFGHPAPLWLLFMTEFWERFAFYGMRWALTLYIVAQFYAGSGSGEAPANRIYGAYLALVYGAGLFGGLVADRVLGHQRAILLGAAIMACGLFVLVLPQQDLFLCGLALVVVGNGLFKPNISALVGQLYAPGDARRDAGFTIFYMGINAGAFVSPLLTGWLASAWSATPLDENYRAVFVAAACGMLLSFVWFWFGRRRLGAVGATPPPARGARPVLIVIGAGLIATPLVYFVLAKLGATALAWALGLLWLGLAALLLREGNRDGPVARDRVAAMLIVFLLNTVFWMFFEQAGSSFNFLAEKIVARQFGAWEFPVAWFQSVNSLAVIALAPLVAAGWVWLGRAGRAPSIPFKFGSGMLFNAAAFLLLMFAFAHLLDAQQKIPFWTLAAVYVLQSLGELCLSPIGLSMTTKLAPTRCAGLAMGGWFLSVANGNNLAGLFASEVSGASGMTAASAASGYAFGFWALGAAALALFLAAPAINRLMHGVR